MPFFLSLFLFSWISVWGQELSIPALSSPVMDEAGFLSADERQSLSDIIYEIHTHNGPQITILTVANLQGYAIEDFSIRVAEKWQLGTKEKGNGLLIIASKEERKIRIEVGEGLEGDITDYESKSYITRLITPQFKAGQFYEGFRLVLNEVAAKFSIELNPKGKKLIRRKVSPLQNNILSSFLPILILVLVGAHLILSRHTAARGVVSGLGVGGMSLLMLPGVGIAAALIFGIVGLLIGLIGINNILYLLASSHGRGGGGGFGGNSGGGSWSGGGGGFSGGGSSGDW